MMQLPFDIQRDFGAQLLPATPTGLGAYRLIAARRAEASSFEGQRITVMVIDENGIALSAVPVAFSFSTAKPYVLTQDFLWTPPPPQKAFIAPTTGAGQIDQIQGSTIKQGEPGGVTVYILEPEFSSDVVTGAGMLFDHTGLHLTYQLQRVGVTSYSERLSALEKWVTDFDARLKAFEA